MGRMHVLRMSGPGKAVLALACVGALFVAGYALGSDTRGTHGGPERATPDGGSPAIVSLGKARAIPALRRRKPPASTAGGVAASTAGAASTGAAGSPDETTASTGSSGAAAPSTQAPAVSAEPPPPPPPEPQRLSSNE